MSIEKVNQILARGEGIRTEYKKSRMALPDNVFESVCAMLNRNGGDIILGVDDDGTVLGIDAPKLDAIKTNIVTLSNNAQKLNPPYILFPEVYTINDEQIIHIQVPSSSQVHKTGRYFYDRSDDGDFRVTEPQQIAELYNNKRAHYTEGIIFEKVVFDDLNVDLFPVIRNLIKSKKANHPWLALTDEQLLQKAGLWKKDYNSGKEGYTLAAVLLLGKDELIQQILPHYKIDALVRIQNTDRYDDRLYIQTNLIDAYNQLLNFVEKHLPDKFYMEDGQRKSLRTSIFREIVANLIVHREYTDAHPATFIIYNDRVETINANNPNGKGLIDIATFSAYPKNPLLAKFFIELGWVDQLGSGVLNVNKFIKQYAGKNSGPPEFLEDTIFKTVIPVPGTVGAISGTSTGAAVVTGTIEGAIEKVIKGKSESVKNRLVKLILVIYEHPDIKVAKLEELFKVSERTIKSDLKLLSSFIYYEGSKKTGVYKLSEELKKVIDEKVAR